VKRLSDGSFFAMKVLPQDNYSSGNILPKLGWLGYWIAWI